jgi:hypothetical protein
MVVGGRLSSAIARLHASERPQMLGQSPRWGAEGSVTITKPCRSHRPLPLLHGIKLKETPFRTLYEPRGHTTSSSRTGAIPGAALAASSPSLSTRGRAQGKDGLSPSEPASRKRPAPQDKSAEPARPASEPGSSHHDCHWACWAEGRARRGQVGDGDRPGRVRDNARRTGELSPRPR